jgi:hypothetical protein
VTPTRRSRVDLSASYDHLRQPIQDSGVGNQQARPTLYHLETLSVGGAWRGTEWGLSPTAGVKDYTYEPNAPAVVGDELDRTVWDGALSIYRRVAGRNELFVTPSVNARRYRRPVGLDGLRHDSSGYQVIGGVRLDLSGVTYARIGAGWMEQDYADAALPTISGPTVSGMLVWNPLSSASLSLEVGRRVDESNVPGDSGIDTKFVDGTLNYEIDYDLMATGKISYENGVYNVSNPANARADDTYRYSLGLRYSLNNHAAVGASWRAFDRVSTAAGQGLTFNRYSINVSLKW